MENEEFIIIPEHITKREYFAGLAMRGLCASIGNEVDTVKIAIVSTRMAEHLIEELEKE